MARRTFIEKLVILNRARAVGNISQACKEFGISRASYYHIKRSIEQRALEMRSAQSESPDRKALIGEIALAGPRLSALAISKQLLDGHGIQISHTTVHSILKELELSRSEQRWRCLEDHFKHGLMPLELSLRQRLFMQKHNPCYSAYQYNLTRPLEQLNLDVVRVGDYRSCIAVDPVTNYAFALILPRMDRKRIIAWLDSDVLAKAVELGFQPSKVAVSARKLFDDNADGELDYHAFGDLCAKHAVKRIDQIAVTPILDGSVQHFHQLLLQAFESLPTQCADADSVAHRLAAWVDDYNRRYQYPHYPNYDLTPTAMLAYYRKHGVVWRGRRTLFARFHGYISPVSGLDARSRPNARVAQASSVYFSWVSSLFK